MFPRARFAVIFLLLAAAPAGAQSTDPDTSMIMLGPVGITPSLALRDVGRDTNVFNERDNPKSDFTLTIVPRAEIVVKPRGLRLGLTTATEYVYFQTYESERSTNLSSAFRADVLLSRIQPFFTYSGTSTNARLNSEVDARARHNERALGGGVNVKVGTMTTLGASYKATRFRYDEGEEFRDQELSESFDSDITVVEGSAGVQLTTFTQLTVAVTHEQQRFDHSSDRDADSLRITPTFSFSPDAVIRGTASVGYRNFKPKSSTLPSYSGLIATVTLATTLFDRHHLDLVVGRDLRYSYDQATPYYLSTGVNATMVTELVGPFDVRANGQYQVLAYRGDTSAGAERPGDDRVMGYGAGIGYRIRERLRVGLNADWTERESDFSDDRGYSGRRVFASLTWGAQ